MTRTVEETKALVRQLVDSYKDRSDFQEMLNTLERPHVADGLAVFLIKATAKPQLAMIFIVFLDYDKAATAHQENTELKLMVARALRKSTWADKLSLREVVASLDTISLVRTGAQDAVFLYSPKDSADKVTFHISSGVIEYQPL